MCPFERLAESPKPESFRKLSKAFESFRKINLSKDFPESLSFRLSDFPLVSESFSFGSFERFRNFWLNLSSKLAAGEEKLRAITSGFVFTRGMTALTVCDATILSMDMDDFRKLSEKVSDLADLSKCCESLGGEGDIILRNAERCIQT